MSCYAYDEHKNIIAECREGEIASFEICEGQTIYVYMSSQLDKTSIFAYPGDRFEVNIRTFTICISKVDIL